MTFQFDSVSAFFWMNGHGPYVWAAYAISLSAIVALVMFVCVAHKNFVRTQRSILERSASHESASRTEIPIDAPSNANH